MVSGHRYVEGVQPGQRRIKIKSLDWQLILILTIIVGQSKSPDQMKYATILVSLMILVAVLIPGRDLPDVDIGSYDKLIHFGMFVVWALAARYDFRTKPSRYYLVFLGGILFSLFTEVLQLPVEGRTFDPYDMAADGVGIIAGLLVSGPVLRILDRII